MRTARTDSPTKDRLLHAAQELMLAKGYNATTVDEICEAAGLTKGSFFHYFRGKEELGAAVLERYCDSTMQMLQAAPHRQIKDPLKRLFGYLDFLMEMSRSPLAAKGCLLGTFAQELSDVEVAAVVSYIRTAWGNHGAPVSPREANALRSVTME